MTMVSVVVAVGLLAFANKVLVEIVARELGDRPQHDPELLEYIRLLEGILRHSNYWADQHQLDEISAAVIGLAEQCIHHETVDPMAAQVCTVPSPSPIPLL